MEIVNSKDSAVMSGSWGNPGSALYDKLLEQANSKSLVKEAYLIVGEGYEEHPSSALKYPHHVIRDGKLVVSKPGVEAASSRLNQMKSADKVSDSEYNSAVAHIGKHRKELELDKLEKMATDEKEVEKKEEEKEKKLNPKEEVKENPKDEAKEEKAEDKKEEIKEKKEENMSLDAYLDVAAMLALLAKETESNEELAAEFAKPEPLRNYGMVMGKMYAKMCKMAKTEEEMGCKMAELDQKMAAYAAENEELKKFKADVEAKQFEFETERTLKEIENSVDMPKEEMAALREEAKKFSLENVEGWKNFAKAKAFSFGVKKVDENPGVMRYGMPFAGLPTKKSDSLWG